MDKLTKIERRFVSAINADPECSHKFDLNNQKEWPDLRKLIKEVAYHEAGHFAARLFTDLDLCHLVDISIIPKDGTLGRLNSKKAYDECSLRLYPLHFQRMVGRILLLEYLAGHGAEMILYESEGWETIADYCNFHYCCDDERSDVHTAYRTALFIDVLYMPFRRTLRLADRWTLEMLRIPALWSVVEFMAGKLIEKGEITNENGELSDLVNMLYPYVPKFYELRRWNPRLYIRPAEEEKCVMDASRYPMTWFRIIC
jgi:hypothetical protein